MAVLTTALESSFRGRFGGAGEARIALAPGRVNLIGEHTDYNDGWVLPMAIERYVGLAYRPRPDCRIVAHARAFEETVELDLVSPAGDCEASWKAYVAGMAWTMVAAGLELTGIDCVIDGDVPLGAGLASSAALEMATARALCDAADIDWSPRRMARLGQEAETRWVGVACGVMDQLTSACGQPGSALLLDCRSRRTEPVPLPDEAAVVVMDTGARRTLAGSAYNERRASCQRAVRGLRRLDPEVAALRDVDRKLLEAARDSLDDLTFRRALHVVEENLRPVAMAAALRDGDLELAGRLMNDSHGSLRDLYEVSGPELDRMTGLARNHPACYGARLTGAGFGGCGVALVAADQAEIFAEDVRRSYVAESGLPAELFTCRAVGGARLHGNALGAAPAPKA